MADVAKVTFKGNPVKLGGPEIKPGQSAPDFTAVDTSLQPVRVADARGKVLILSAVPSLDTPVCDLQTRRFNEEGAKLPNVEIWTISMDLPFAQKRWCGAADVKNLTAASDHRAMSFGDAYGTHIKDFRLEQRSVFVVDQHDVVRHAEYVVNTGTEPDYDAALKVVRSLL